MSVDVYGLLNVLAMAKDEYTYTLYKQMLDVRCLDKNRSLSQCCLAANGPVDCSLAFASHNHFPWKTVHSTLPEKGHQAAMSAQRLQQKTVFHF